MCLNIINNISVLGYQISRRIAAGASAVGLFMNRLYSLICCRDLEPDNIVSRVNNIASQSIASSSEIDDDNHQDDDIEIDDTKIDDTKIDDTKIDD